MKVSNFFYLAETYRKLKRECSNDYIYATISNMLQILKAQWNKNYKVLVGK